MEEDNGKVDNGKARNRDNQRRSRQRQREYISSLESRLLAYEKQAAAASRELQLAARRVAEENRLLRDLLRRAGVQAVDIEAHLSARRPLNHGGTATDDRPGHPASPHSQAPETTSSDLQASDRERAMASDETTCEDAARIIASMRGGAHPEDILPELGCSSQMQCSIKNSHIFDLAERSTA